MLTHSQERSSQKFGITGTTPYQRKLFIVQLQNALDVLKTLFEKISASCANKTCRLRWIFKYDSSSHGFIVDDEDVDMTATNSYNTLDSKYPEFVSPLIQHMESVKKSIDERAQHKEEYDSWVNERQIQTTEDKVDTGKAVDASLVNTESIGTESKEQDTSSRSGNETC
ncbi:hypothetical protein Tco_0903644 [Tanacetum coccineum]